MSPPLLFEKFYPGQIGTIEKALCTAGATQDEVKTLLKSPLLFMTMRDLLWHLRSKQEPVYQQAAGDQLPVVQQMAYQQPESD